MAITTPNLGLTIPAHNDPGTTWEPAIDGNLALIDSAVGANSAAIVTEVTRAESAETILATDLAAESVRATTAEATRATTVALTAETARAEGAESANATGIAANATAIASETTRAQAAESLNATNIANNAANLSTEATTRSIADGANATAITAEVSRATTAEGLLLPINTAASTYATQTSLTAEATVRANADALLLSIATAAINYAPLANPTFTGTATASTLQSTGGVNLGTAGAHCSWTLDNEIDPANSGSNALYIYPSTDENRIYFGKSGKRVYSLNFTNVVAFENVPSIAVGTTGALGYADVMFQRANSTIMTLGGSSPQQQCGTLGLQQLNASELVVTVLAAPTNSAFTAATTGGTLAPGTYYYRVCALDAIGTSLASTETSIVVPAGSSTNTVTVNWSGVQQATSYKVYGRTSGAEQLIGTTVGWVLTFVDTGSVTPSGALPTTNTTGQVQIGGKITKYNGVATAGLGHASIVAAISLTGQTAQISGTTLFTPATSGTFRIAMYAYLQAQGTAGNYTPWVRWNDGTGLVGLQPPGSITVTTTIPAFLVGYWTVHVAAGQAITYGVNANSITGTPQFGIDVVVEQLQ